MMGDPTADILIRMNGREFRAPDLAMLKQWCAEGRIRAEALVLLPGAGWVPAAECDPLRAAFDRERPEHVSGDWFVRIGNDQYAAPSFSELKRWHRMGRVPRQALVYHQVLNAWVPAARVPGLETPSAHVLHKLNVTFRGGIKGFAKEQGGIAYLTSDGFEFHGHPIHFDVGFESILGVSLDSFRPSALRVISVSSGSVPQVKNVLCVSYRDEEATSRVAEFQAHGALSLQGEGENAAQFMNRMNDFKSRFAREDVGNTANDATTVLRELKNLLDAGVLTVDEFEAKKSDLLRRI